MTKKFYCLLLIACVFWAGKLCAQIQPVDSISPTGTLPILHINTCDSVPVDQKVEYIDAVYWLDATMCEEFESIGSEDSPLALGIRGRGNASWTHDGQKPYKIKLDKKQSLLGMAKNKHWALLAKITYPALFNEYLGFEIGRRIGLKYTPYTQPVEVILNGTYIGLYMLTETVRVDDNRVNIFEQPDENEDEETIPYGWLVEFDNYDDECQVVIPQPQGRDMRLTYSTPEVLNDKQREFLVNEFTTMTGLIYTDNKLDRSWEDYIDIDALARHYVAQEIVDNGDAYNGSCKIHRDLDSKWTFGPLWDLSWAFGAIKEKLQSDNSYHIWIGEIYKFPEFRNKVLDVFNQYVDSVGNEWVEPFLQEFHSRIEPAIERTMQVWPYQDLRPATGYKYVGKVYDGNMAYLSERFAHDCVTYRLTCESIYPYTDCDDTGSDDMPVTELPRILVNGLELDSVAVLPDMQIHFTTKGVENHYELVKVFINDEDASELICDNAFTLSGITEDTKISTCFAKNTSGVENVSALYPDDSFEVSVLQGVLTVTTADSSSLLYVYDMSGRQVYAGLDRNVRLPYSGAFMVRLNNTTKKVLAVGI